jgi:hypothetical protein
MKRACLISLATVLPVGSILTSYVSVATPPAAAIGLRCEAVSIYQIDLSWDASSLEWPRFRVIVSTQQLLWPLRSMNLFMHGTRAEFFLRSCSVLDKASRSPETALEVLKSVIQCGQRRHRGRSQMFWATLSWKNEGHSSHYLMVVVLALFN